MSVAKLGMSRVGREECVEDCSGGQRLLERAQGKAENVGHVGLKSLRKPFLFGHLRQRGSSLNICLQ